MTRGDGVNSSLGEVLRTLRDNMSLREASEKTGLSHTYIRDVEQGFNRSRGTTIHPTPETLRKFAIAYRYPYEDLMGLAGYTDHDAPEEGPVLRAGVAIEDLRESYGLTLDGERVTDEKLTWLIAILRTRRSISPR